MEASRDSFIPIHCSHCVNCRDSHSRNKAKMRFLSATALLRFASAKIYIFCLSEKKNSQHGDSQPSRTGTPLLRAGTDAHAAALFRLRPAPHCRVAEAAADGAATGGRRLGRARPNRHPHGPFGAPLPSPLQRPSEGTRTGLGHDTEGTRTRQPVAPDLQAVIPNIVYLIGFQPYLHFPPSTGRVGREPGKAAVGTPSEGRFF